MATIIGEMELKTIIQNNEIIQNGDVKCAEGLKYDFRLGKKFLKAGSSSPKTYEELCACDKDCIEPGEVVFVLSEERLNVPKDVFIQLHTKRKLSHDGINLFGGTSVDPGYSGYLIFGMYNVAGTKYPLRPGRKLIGATFYRLSKNEIVNEPSRIPEPLEDFPDNLIDLIDRYKPVNPIAINEKLQELQSRFDRDTGVLLAKIDLLNEKIGNVDTKAESIKETVNKITIWAKIIVGILGIAAAVAAGLLTGLFEKLFT